MGIKKNHVSPSESMLKQVTVSSTKRSTSDLNKSVSVIESSKSKSRQVSVLDIDEKPRSWLKRQSRSIFVYITTAVAISTLLALCISIAWFVMFLIIELKTFKLLNQSEFASLYKNFQAAIVQPQIVAKTAASTMVPELLSNDTGYSTLRYTLERMVKSNVDLFPAGIQVYYVSSTRRLGFKKSPDANKNIWQHFIVWNTNTTRNELPDPDYHFDTLLYYEYTDWDNSILKPEPVKIINNFGYPGDSGTIALRSITPQVKRGVYTEPILMACPTKENICSFILQYAEIPQASVDDGYFSAGIQISYFSQMMIKNREPGVTTFVVVRSSNDIIGSSLDGYSYYQWNEETSKHEKIKATKFSNPLIQTISSHLISKYGDKYDRLSSSQVTQESITMNGEVHYVDAQVLEGPGLDLVLVSTVPEWHYIGTPTTIGISLIIVSIVTFLVSLSSGLLISCIVYKPLRHFIDDLNDVSDGLDLESVRFGSRPFFTEIDDLQVNFKYLVNKLSVYRTFLPDHILKKMDENENDVVIDDDNASEVSFLQSNDVTSEVSEEIRSDHESSRSSNSYKKIGASSLGLQCHKASYIALHFKYRVEDNISSNMRIFGQILQTVSHAAATQQGFLEHFDEKHIIIGINTLTRMKNHPQNALRLAYRLSQSLKSMIQYGDGDGSFYFGIGISTGLTHMGTIGSINKRTWKSIGKPVQIAALLARKALSDKSSFPLFDKVVHNTIKASGDFQTRLADILYTNVLGRQKVFQLVSMVIKKNDEWFYELKNQEDASWTESYNTAILFADKGKTSSAIVSLEKFLKSYPQDKLGKVWSNLLRHLIDSNLTLEEFTNECLEKDNFIDNMKYLSLIQNFRN